MYRLLVEENKAASGNGDSSFDILAKTLTYIPGLLLRGAVAFLRTLDYFGLLPRFLTHLSPFHGSLAITSMGSLGIPPIHHHLYDFGNILFYIIYNSNIHNWFFNNAKICQCINISVMSSIPYTILLCVFK